MDEVSIILKENIDIPVEEYQALTRCSYIGNFWLVIRTPSVTTPYKTTWRGTEYIFSPEDFTAFRLISKNILLQWETIATMHLPYYREFQVTESVCLRHLPIDYST